MQKQFSKKVVSERRTHQRKRHLKHAKILFNGNKSVCNALLRNISAGGANLEFSMPETLPDKFTLQLVTDNVVVPCHIKWRSTEGLGVEF